MYACSSGSQSKRRGGVGIPSFCQFSRTKRGKKINERLRKLKLMDVTIVPAEKDIMSLNQQDYVNQY